MHSVHPVPEGVSPPEIKDLIVVRPTSWIGMALEWTTERDPVPVFVRRFRLPDPDGKDDFLFGQRHYVSDVLCDGELVGDGEGHFIEYFVVEESPGGGWLLHRLLQRGVAGSTAYAEESAPGADVEARSVDAKAHSVDAPPRWKPSEAYWPTYHEEPMSFLGQVPLPENDVISEHFSWGDNVYLFWARANGVNHFKIFQ